MNYIFIILFCSLHGLCFQISFFNLFIWLSDFMLKAFFYCQVIFGFSFIFNRRHLKGSEWETAQMRFNSRGFTGVGCALWLYKEPVFEFPALFRTIPEPGTLERLETPSGQIVGEQKEALWACTLSSFSTKGFLLLCFVGEGWQNLKDLPPCFKRKIEGGREREGLSHSLFGENFRSVTTTNINCGRWPQPSWRKSRPH